MGYLIVFITGVWFGILTMIIIYVISREARHDKKTANNDIQFRDF